MIGMDLPGRGMGMRLFYREENITVSSGEEAVLRIYGLKSRFYIRGMQGF